MVGGCRNAVFGYLVMHRLANPAAISAGQPWQMGNLIAQSMVAGIAYAGQYIVPLVGLIGAAISFFRRKQRVALITDVAQAQSTDALDGMSWREFEMRINRGPD